MSSGATFCRATQPGGRCHTQPCLTGRVSPARPRSGEDGVLEVATASRVNHQPHPADDSHTRTNRTRRNRSGPPFPALTRATAPVACVPASSRRADVWLAGARKIGNHFIPPMRDFVSPGATRDPRIPRAIPFARVAANGVACAGNQPGTAALNTGCSVRAQITRQQSRQPAPEPNGLARLLQSWSAPCHSAEERSGEGMVTCRAFARLCSQHPACGSGQPACSV